MKEYLFEMHAHNKEVSRCARASARELVECYIAHGYDGVVSTNHMNSHTFEEKRFSSASWNEKAEHFLSGYRMLQEAADGRIKILLGMEITFRGDPNDYLVYGVTEDFIRNNGDIMSLTNEEFSVLAHDNGLLFVQAHPFRREMQIVDWDILDGYEIYNGNPRHISSNSITEQWAKLHGKNLVTSGSDFHEIGDAGNGGIYFPETINSNSDLLNALKSGNYRLKM